MPELPGIPQAAVEACKPSTLSDDILRRVLELGAPALRKQWEAEYRDGLEDRLPDWLLAEIREGTVADLRERLTGESADAHLAQSRALQAFLEQADKERPSPPGYGAICAAIGAALDSIGVNEEGSDA